MQIHVVKNENGISEWIALEMQGNIEGSCLEGQLAGNLAWRKDGQEVVLVVGHHLLEGKLCSLDKPLLVMSPSENHSDKTMIVDGIITRRIVFKNRPKPIVSKTSTHNL